LARFTAIINLQINKKIMKKISFLGAVLLAGFSVSAQNFVSTTASNKNAIIEEYTGIKCTWCPAGHKIGNDLVKANPGRVVLVNIHTGGYATPSAGQPDFRTSEGDAIAGHSAVDIKGYPAGTVNRVKGSTPQGVGTASSRGTWAVDASTIMSQSSPVNIAVQASYDKAKNEVTAVVEVYYTGTQTVTSNMVSVAILENNIDGPQTGGSKYPEKVNPDGSYSHNHMLRTMLTPAFGEAVDTIASSSFWTKTYTWKVPTDLKGVPVKFWDLEVAAWVAEDQQTILTATDTKVTLPTSILSDLSATDKSTKPASQCDHDYTPSIEFENMEANVITSFDMSYSVNGGTPVVKSYAGSLAKNAKTTLIWPKVSLPAGSVNNIAYAGPTNINGGALIDVNGSNNKIASSQFVAVASNAIKSGLSEDFSNYSTGNLPTNWFNIVESGTGMVGRTFITSGFTAPNVSSRGNAIWFSTSFGASGDEVSVMIGELDGSAIKDIGVKFAYAAAALDANSNDKLELMVSNDCGKTWTTKWAKTGSELNYFGTNNQSIIAPAAEDNWNEATVNVDATGGVLVKFKVSTGRGNSLWLDDIQVFSTTSTGAELESVSKITTYPNPVNDNLSIDISSDEASSINVKIIDIMGKVIMDLGSKELQTGLNTISVNTSSLASGMYNVEVSSTEGSVVKRIIVE
jgi:hypothetical protein|tara:strand:- start:50 stop:2104 length:2055 start_codon:yes stop_codon:yes gene_type:complete